MSPEAPVRDASARSGRSTSALLRSGRTCACTKVAAGNRVTRAELRRAIDRSGVCACLPGCGLGDADLEYVGRQRVGAVRSLDLSQNSLSSPQLGDSWESLALLALNDNEVECLTGLSTVLPRLRVLQLQRASLSRYPAELRLASGLEELDLSYNQISTLPSYVDRLKQLRDLKMRKNSVRTLPASLARLVHLRSLDVSHNQLRALPRLPEALEILSAGGNFLPVVSLEGLPHIEWLELSSNALADMPGGIEGAPRLAHIDLSYNRLKELPPALCRLAALETLVVSHNELARLPLGIGKLQRLRCLDASFNAIEGSPPALVVMSSLRELRLANNALSEAPQLPWPPAGSSHNSLQLVDVGNNRIEELSQSFVSGASGVERLVLLGNPLRGAPPEALAMPPRELIAYLCSPQDSRKQMERAFPKRASTLLRAPGDCDSDADVDGGGDGGGGGEPRSSPVRSSVTFHNAPGRVPCQHETSE